MTHGLCYPHASEPAHWLVAHDTIAEALGEHLEKDGRCVSCRRPYPCGWRKHAEQALTVHRWSQTRGLPADPPRTASAPVYRASAYRDDGTARAVEWYGRAEYPNLESAKIWLTLTLEYLRRYEAPGTVWGDVIAGVLAPDPRGSTPFGPWFATQPRGATAHLRTPHAPIIWTTPALP